MDFVMFLLKWEKFREKLQWRERCIASLMPFDACPCQLEQWHQRIDFTLRSYGLVFCTSQSQHFTLYTGHLFPAQLLHDGEDGIVNKSVLKVCQGIVDSLVSYMLTLQEEAVSGEWVGCCSVLLHSFWLFVDSENKCVFWDEVWWNHKGIRQPLSFLWLCRKRTIVELQPQQGETCVLHQHPLLVHESRAVADHSTCSFPGAIPQDGLAGEVNVRATAIAENENHHAF